MQCVHLAKKEDNTVDENGRLAWPAPRRNPFLQQTRSLQVGKLSAIHMTIITVNTVPLHHGLFP